MYQLLHLDRLRPLLKHGDTVQLTSVLARASSTPRRSAFNFCALASLGCFGGVIAWAAGLVIEWAQVLAVSSAVVIDWLWRVLNIGSAYQNCAGCQLNQGSHRPVAAPWSANATV